MVTKKVSDGVGKKIVEALKKQSEIEINPIAVEEESETMVSESFDVETEQIQENISEGDFLNNLPSDDDLAKLANNENIVSELDQTSEFVDETSANAASIPFVSPSQQNYSSNENLIKELDSFEIPSNISVLKKLISQLPSGVTRHTGAQIIKQTMEALGISMKSVLQEAQQVQEGLRNSANECHSTIQEYKKQIVLLEKQAQNNQRQYAALNELISLFIQTGM